MFCVCLAQKDVADAFAAVADGGGQKGLWESCPARQAGFGKAQRPDVGAQVGQAQRFGNVAEMIEEFQRIGQIPQTLDHVGGQAGGEKVFGRTRIVEEGEQAVAGADERAGGVEDALQDGVEVEAFVDEQAGAAQAGEALPQRFNLLHGFVGGCHSSFLAWA